MGYSGAQGTLIYEKNLKSKILCQTPFKSTGYWFFVVALLKERKQALAPFPGDPAPPVLISFLFQNWVEFNIIYLNPLQLGFPRWSSLQQVPGQRKRCLAFLFI